MKTLRTVHLYLGLTLAPLLLFFAMSGAWQAFDFHESRKDHSYQAPRVLSALSRVHTKQRLKSFLGATKRSYVFQWMSSVAGAGIAVLALLGIVMAFRMARNKWLPAALLGLGALLPVSVFVSGGF